MISRATRAVSNLRRGKNDYLEGIIYEINLAHRYTP